MFALMSSSAYELHARLARGEPAIAMVSSDALGNTGGDSRCIELPGVIGGPSLTGKRRPVRMSGCSWPEALALMPRERVESAPPTGGSLNGELS